MPWKSIVDKISCRRLSNRPQFVVWLKAILKLIISEYCENTWHRPPCLDQKILEDINSLNQVTKICKISLQTSSRSVRHKHHCCVWCLGCNQHPGVWCFVESTGFDKPEGFLGCKKNRASKHRQEPH